MLAPAPTPPIPTRIDLPPPNPGYPPVSTVAARHSWRRTPARAPADPLATPKMTPAHPTPPEAPLAPPASRTRLLITAGPTHEPIDAVRYLANRSSGRLGIALAEEAGARGHDVTLLLGPTHLEPTHTRVSTHRFQTTADLRTLLGAHFPACDVLIMAAAVADYRPSPPPDGPPTKLRRTGDDLTLTLEPTPDLLAELADRKRPDQLTIGFALEPEERLEASARDKLARKGLDAIVANPLETMDAPTIGATVLTASGARHHCAEIDKREFAPWLLDLTGALWLARNAGSTRTE